MRISALLVAAALLVAGIGCGAQQGAERGNERAAPEPAAPSADPKAPLALPARAGSLPSGVYASRVFAPGFELTLDRGWSVFAPEQPRLVGLAFGDAERLLGIVNPARVVDPSKSFLDDDDTLEDALLPVPDDLATWIVDHPRLRAGVPRSTRVAGVPATVVDYRTTRAYAAPGCPGRCVLLLAADPSSVQVSVEGDVNRLYILKIRGQTIVISALAPRRQFKAFAAEVARVIKFLRFVPER